jgi:hypothetical protein
MVHSRVTPDDEVRLFPVQALALSLVAPWSAIRQGWANKGVAASLLYHVLGLALLGVGLIIIDAVLWYGDITDIFQFMGPGEFALLLIVFAVYLLLIQLSYGVAAVLTSSWGAGVEPFRASFGRSLSRWYQLTPFHAAWTLALILVLHVLSEMRWNSWDYSESREFVYNTLMVGCFVVYIGVGGWFTLMALAVPRKSDMYYPKSRWPALCETCGYAVVGLTAEQTCPECGRVVGSSLYTVRNQPEVRQPALLERMRRALINPAAMGLTLITQTRTPGPAQALSRSAFALFALGPVAIVYVMLVLKVVHDESVFYNFYDFATAFIIGGTAAGLGAIAVGVAIVLAAGSIIGLIERLFGKRNNLPAACAAACYASGYVVFLAILMIGFTGVLVATAEAAFDHFGYGIQFVYVFGWPVVALLLTLPYLVIVGRITRAARYANA